MSDIAITIPCHARTVRGLDEPRVFVNEGKVVANSEDVASYFGKQHSHVLRDIRRLIQNDNSCASNFGWTYRDMRMPSGGTRPIATCNMTRDVTILTKDGSQLPVGWVPEVALLKDLSLEDIVSELEGRMRQAAEKAYEAGFEDFRARLSNFMNSDKRSVL